MFSAFRCCARHVSASRIAGWLPEAGAAAPTRLETQLIELDDISYEAENLNMKAPLLPPEDSNILLKAGYIYSLMQKTAAGHDELLAVHGGWKKQ